MTTASLGRVSLVALVVAATMIHATSSTAQTRAIAGTVAADSARGRPVENAEVMVPALSLSVRTTPKGEFRLAELPPGRYLVLVRLIGYQTVMDSITVGTDADARHDFVLRESAVVLDSVVAQAKQPRAYISSNLNGFLERMRRHAGGYFIDDSTLRKNENDRLPEVLSSRLGGMRLLRLSGDAAYMVSTRSSGLARGGGDSKFNPLPRECYSTVYLDGLVIYDLARTGRDSRPPDLSAFAVSDLADVEFYPGKASLPVEFGSSDCGTLLLWTREK
jgi:Carboxypeptidase regulatory-like domain